MQLNILKDKMEEIDFLKAIIRELQNMIKVIEGRIKSLEKKK
jgi:hypothetical protein